MKKLNKDLKKFVTTFYKIKDEKGLSLREIARRANTSYGYIGHIIHYRRGIPKDETISRLAKGLGVNRSILFHAAGYDYVPVSKEEQKHASEKTIIGKSGDEKHPVFSYKGKPIDKVSWIAIQRILDSIPDPKDRK